MTYRVISEAKPCFDFTTEDEQEAEAMALRVAVITARTTRVITVEVCMTCTAEITETNPRTDDVMCLSCHPADCLLCAAGEGMVHNYEPPSGS